VENAPEDIADDENIQLEWVIRGVNREFWDVLIPTKISQRQFGIDVWRYMYRYTKVDIIILDMDLRPRNRPRKGPRIGQVSVPHRMEALRVHLPSVHQ